MAQNISIGTSDNAGDGQSLREAFRRVRKNFAEIYGDTDSANLTDTETLPTGTFVESVQDIVGGMLTGNTENNITVTYQDSDGTIDFDVAADITDVNAGSGLTGTGESGGAATLNVGAGTGITVNADDVELNLNDLGAAVVDVANDSIAIIDSSASNASKKETIADLVAAMAGTGLSASSGQLSVSASDNNTTYTTSAVDSGDDAIIRLTGSDSTTEDIKLVAGSNITITPSGDDITIAASGGSNTNTTYTINAADGANSDEEKIVITGSDSSTDEIVLEAGTGLSIARSGDKITFTNTVSDTDTNTFRTVTAGGNTLGASETLAFTAGTNVTITETGGAVTINATDTDTVYTLPEATSTVRGGIELFSDTDQSVAANAVSSTAGRTYGVQLNSSGQAVVNVPWSDTNTNTQLSDEQVQDIVGGMVTGNTETGIDVTYQDADGTIDFAVDVSDFMTNGSNNRVLTATGTDAMNAEANLVFDGSNLGLNVTSPSSYAFNGSALVVNNSSGYGIVSIVSDVNKTGYLSFADGTTGSDRYRGSIEYGHTNDIMQFRSAGSINMVLDSTGQLGIGTTSPDYTLDVAGDIGVDANIVHNSDTDTYINFGTDAINFYAGGARMLTLSEGGTDEVVVNENSGDIDFRVESNNKTKALFVNGETDHVQASVGVESNAGTGNMTLDAEKYGVFKLTGNITTSTLTIDNMQEGQVIDIILSGTLTSAAITLSSDGTGRTFNNVGGGTLDTSATNHIQVVCIDDTAASKIFNYSIATYSSDNQP